MPLLEPRATRLALAALATVGIAVAAPAAEASIGVGVQANPVRLAGTAHPGGSYDLPSLFVVNTGSQPESLTVQVKRLAGDTGQAFPASWVQVGTVNGDLRPRQQALVSVRLLPPAGAKPGSYRGDLVVTGMPSSSGPATGGVRFGAGATTPLEFTIAPGPAGGGWLGLPIWKWWLIGVLAVVAAATLIVRRTGLRVRIETGSAARSGGPNA
jgi:hypothetical protein